MLLWSSFPPFYLKTLHCGYEVPPRGLYYGNEAQVLQWIHYLTDTKDKRTQRKNEKLRPVF